MRTSRLLRCATALALCCSHVAAAPLFKAPYLAFGTARQPTWTAMGDLNADGKADMVLASDLDQSITVLLSNGDGTFAHRTDYVTGEHPFAIAIGDLNGGGVPDLVVPNEGSHTISVFIGRGD